MVLILHTSMGFIGREKGGVAGGYSSNYIGNTLCLRKSRPKVFAVAGVGAKAPRRHKGCIATRWRCDLQVLTVTSGFPHRLLAA
jgi:hypothetical protein